ncbi:MAG: hypothetical protein GF344_02460 [Chitinivibrionales bacterium]|nr:hypothetical protein [Chitinivibrionales bacterium]
MHGMPALLVIGLITIAGFYVGRSMRWLRLPSIIGFMITGVLAGPSLLGFLEETMITDLGFITQIALGFVAISIGLELSLGGLRKQGKGIIVIILTESLGAFLIVTLCLYLLTRNIPLALIFGAIAPASAPAGTVAVIQELKARGSLTKALYSVVGFDDGLGIVIFGFALAMARTILLHQAGNADDGGLMTVLGRPLLEVVFSLLIGGTSSIVFCMLARRHDNPRDMFVLLFGFMFANVGLSIALHLSLILTNMVFGMVVVNTQPHVLVQRIADELRNVMPLLFVLFFTLAGANLHIDALPALGLIGFVYILARSAGLMGGAYIGAVLGKADDKIRRYLGMGILSQAGVAIGLALTVVHDLQGLGPLVTGKKGETVPAGDKIGIITITTITATSIFFELIGPILTKIALEKAGEVNAVSGRAG